MRKLEKSVKKVAFPGAIVSIRAKSIPGNGLKTFITGRLSD